MKWSRIPSVSTLGSMVTPKKSSYLSSDGLYRVTPRFARGYGNRRLKSVVWILHEGGKSIGKPFASARLAKAFAEAFAAIEPTDWRARHRFLHDGGEWCYQKEREWRRERAERSYTSRANGKEE